MAYTRSAQRSERRAVTAPAASATAGVVRAISYSLSARLPVRPKLPVKVRPALFRKEDPAALELYALASAWNRVSEPVRPFHVEVDIVRSPDDQGGCLRARCRKPRGNAERRACAARCAP